MTIKTKFYRPISTTKKGIKSSKHQKINSSKPKPKNCTTALFATGSLGLAGAVYLAFKESDRHNVSKDDNEDNVPHL